jgi:hypothetical protein
LEVTIALTYRLPYETVHGFLWADPAKSTFVPGHLPSVPVNLDAFVFLQGFFDSFGRS